MLKLKPVFFEKIWGGAKISKEFGLKSNKLGEAWIISGYQGKASEIIEGEFKGKTLDVIYKKYPALFGNYKTKEFPLLIKLIHAKDNLSVQVHPDDKYAQEKENFPFGKYESWYILEVKKDTKIIVGHNFNNPKEVQDAYDKNEWKDKFNVQSIQEGDVFDITPGTVHAICKDTYLYEIQQSSDITYRLYDYGRLEDGNPRKLHIEKSKDVIDYNKKIIKKQNKNNKELITNKYFKLIKEVISNEINSKYDDPFITITCTKGQGTINSESIKKNESFVITNDELRNEVNFNGEMELLIGSPK